MAFAWKAAGITYNRYLAVAARAVRRGLKEEKARAARPEAEIKVAKWTNGKQSEPVSLPEANAAVRAEAAGKSSS
ncbi:hypothetical protein VUR80DRAFT_7014 [Thermomyces stellatus]